MSEEGPLQGLEVRSSIVGVLAANTRARVMMAILYYLWLSFGNPLYARMVSMNTSGQPELFGGITSTERKGRLSRLVLSRRGIPTAATRPWMYCWTVARPGPISTMPSPPDCVTG